MDFAHPNRTNQPAKDFDKTLLTKIRADEDAVTVTYDGKVSTIPLESGYGIEFDFVNQKVSCYSRG